MSGVQSTTRVVSLDSEMSDYEITEEPEDYGDQEENFSGKKERKYSQNNPQVGNTRGNI